MSPNEKKLLTQLHIARLLYLITITLSLYLLYLSRADEIYTVWGVINPAFLPTFIIATFLLLTIILSFEKIECKLLFTILHSIVSHSFMVIMFPAGNVGVQQTMLGQTRLVFDNIIFHGLGWGQGSLLSQLYVSLRGENLQTAFSVIFARMLGIDVYWTHLLLLPLLWGIFVPILAFMTSKALGGSENISALSSLIVSLFPANIIWGAVSIPNGLSYLFFFGFICFFLKYMKSNETKDLFLVAGFFFVSFVSHYLAGVIAFSVLILAYSVKTYEKQKWDSPISARLVLLLSFIFCISIMPFTLVYRRFFYPTANTHFSLQKLHEYSPVEMVLSLLLGSYFDLISREAYITTLIFAVPTLLGLVALTYVLITGVKKSPKRSIDPSLLFLSLGLLMVMVDDRIVKLFMANVPFIELERLWIFRDFLLVSFTALIIGSGIQKVQALFITLSRNIIAFLRKTFFARMFSKASPVFTRSHPVNCASLRSVSAYVLVFTIVSGWITASVYYAYPHWGPLQTTSYELEAAKYIDEITNGTYIVICDQWMIFAGEMFVGIMNQRAFYFSPTDPHGVMLFIRMKHNSSIETLIEAMEINNAATAYFIIERPRLGSIEYYRIKSQAMENDLKTLPLPKRISHYRDEEKICIFYYKEQSAKVNE